MSSSHEVTQVSALCRALVTALRSVANTDIVTDRGLRQVLDDLDRTQFRYTGIQMLAAMVLFGHGRMNLAARLNGQHGWSISEMATELSRENSIDNELVNDCFAVVQALTNRNEFPQDVAVQVALRKSVSKAAEWGDYAYLTLAHVYLRTINTYASVSGNLDPSNVLVRWSLEDELYQLASDDDRSAGAG
jgi:hypothetical protein